MKEEGRTKASRGEVDSHNDVPNIAFNAIVEYICSYTISAFSGPLKRILVELHFQHELNILNNCPSKTVKKKKYWIKKC